MISRTNQPHPEFPQKSSMLYLNHAAVSPWPMRTAEAVNRFSQECVESGARYYPQWLQQEELLRQQLAQIIQVPDANDIALLKNTSEGLSVIASGLDWQRGDNLVITDQEFPSNRIPWEALQSRGVEVREAQLHHPELTPEQAIVSQIDSRTRLVSVSSVQYGTGLRLDLAPIGAACKQQGALFCVDAIQSLGAAALHTQQIQADFVVADGHKWMLGPEGLALFYSTPEARAQLALHQYGWHMVESPGDYDRREWHIARSARRFECGSPNMLCAHALSASLSLLLETGLDNVEQQIHKRIAWIDDQLRQLPRIESITPIAQPRRLGIYTFKRTDTNDQSQLFEYLQASSVVCAQRGGGIRLSPHFYTPESVIETSIELISNFKP